jgi:uncharacterized zinc-type alcohol dehydrogenase-like protein
LVVPEDFVLKIPPSLRPELAAPILCAGVTTYAPMKHWEVKAGDKVGINSFGGLGNIAAKIALAMGAEVVLFMTTEEKITEALEVGVKAVLAGELKEGTEAFKEHKGTFDFILSTVPEKSDLNPLIPLHRE